MSHKQERYYLLLIAVTIWLIYLLAPILTPFLLAAFLAYMGDPIVDRLETLKLSRTLSVTSVFVCMTVLGFALALIFLPLLHQQILALINKVPIAFAWLEENFFKKIVEGGDASAQASHAEALKEALSSHWQQIAGTLTEVVNHVTHSSQLLISWLAFLVLIPVITFYLLRDWDILISAIHDLLPRNIEPTVVRLAQECDEVLAQFIRGQFLVMIGQGLLYMTGLWLVGLELAFSIGVLAGLVSFVPYLGFIVGISVAILAALIQFQDAQHIIYIVVVFVIGHAIEGFVLAPTLVGERMGLHPVAVIFAVLAGGQLFGFFGVLLALPMAAIIMVLLRHSKELYMGSNFYTP